MAQVPTVSRTVHYQPFGTPEGEYFAEPRAAIVTAVKRGGDPESEVSLCVLNPDGMFFNRRVPFSPEPKPGHWSWPPRV